MLRLYQVISYLNLDVVAGALAGSHFAASALNLPAGQGAMHVCLALSVWLIYTADRILDVHKKKYRPTHRRHLFAHRYTKVLLVMCALALGINTYLAFFLLPADIVFFGLLITAAVVSYYILLLMLEKEKSLWFQKEPVIAAIYTSAVWGSHLWLKGGVAGHEFYYYIVPFFCLALMNLVVFSFYETEADELNNERSIVTSLGTRATTIIMIVAFALVLTLGVTLLREVPSAHNLLISGTYAVMAFLLFSLYYRNDYFYRNERYRIVGDAVFMLPYFVSFYL